jgi:translation initiation factor 2B subunit (eIF-2B alpha/beta/delta family)
MPSRADLARAAAAGLDEGETILVHGFSEALASALEEAQRAGKRPRVLCGEGLPLLEGRRLARRLAQLELPLTLVYDAALADLVPEADRIWLASEALGARALLAQAGARRLAREALEHDVPLQLLATSDALLPGGALSEPRWMSADRSLLWVEAPATVELRTCFLEELPLEQVPEILTEKGRESAEELFLRSLRLERAARCGAPAGPATAEPARANPRGVLQPARRGAAPLRSAEEQRTRTSS